MVGWMKMIFIVLSLFILAGCSAEEATLAPDQEIAYQEETPPFPEEVQPIVNVVSRTGGVRAVNVIDKTYIIVALGERRTAGYSVQIQSIRLDDRQIIVTFKEKRPAPNDMVAQVVTYPYKVVSIPYTTYPIRFNKI